MNDLFVLLILAVLAGFALCSCTRKKKRIAGGCCGCCSQCNICRRPE